MVPIFVSEAAPPNSRGRLLMSWRTFTVLGLLLGGSVNLVFHGPHDVYSQEMVDARSIAHGDVWRQKVAWRLQIAFPAALLLCMLLICPE